MAIALFFADCKLLLPTHFHAFAGIYVIRSLFFIIPGVDYRPIFIGFNIFNDSIVDIAYG